MSWYTGSSTSGMLRQAWVCEVGHCTPCSTSTDCNLPGNPCSNPNYGSSDTGTLGSPVTPKSNSPFYPNVYASFYLTTYQPSPPHTDITFKAYVGTGSHPTLILTVSGSNIAPTYDSGLSSYFYLIDFKTAIVANPLWTADGINQDYYYNGGTTTRIFFSWISSAVNVKSPTPVPIITY